MTYRDIMISVLRHTILAAALTVAGLAHADAVVARVASAPPTGLDAAGQLQVVQAELGAVTPPAGGFAWTRLAAGVQFQHDGVTKSLIFYGPGMVRVSAHRGQNHAHQASLAVVAQPRELTLEVSEAADVLEVRSPALRISVN